LLKTDTNPYTCPIRPTTWGPDPNWPMNGSKQGGYDLGVFVQGGGFGRTPPETTAAAKQNLIEFCALVNLKPQ